jgi:hypothetical protein
MGGALAFGSWPALMIVLSGVVPTFAWRARAEEKLLSRTFGERYAVYRQQTKMIIRDRWDFDAFVEFGLSVIVSGLDTRSRDGARS